MTDEEEHDEHYFGHWLPIWEYQNQEEIKEKLLKWKYFILHEYLNMKQIGEDIWIHKKIDGWEGMVNTPPETLALKICLKGDLPKGGLND